MKSTFGVREKMSRFTTATTTCRGAAVIPEAMDGSNPGTRHR
jgi:hypothetical protein